MGLAKYLLFLSPANLKKKTEKEKILKIICWYWINNDEIVYTMNAFHRHFISDDKSLINIPGLTIPNKRPCADVSYLENDWHIKTRGNDGYP